MDERKKFSVKVSLLIERINHLLSILKRKIGICTPIRFRKTCEPVNVGRKTLWSKLGPIEGLEPAMINCLKGKSSKHHPKRLVETKTTFPGSDSYNV